MRRVKLQMQLSLDGFVCGPNGEMDWMVADWDEEVKNYATRLTGSVDTVLLGRATAEGMAIYWPTVAGNPQSKPEDIWMAEQLNSRPKVVFSKTVTSVNWSNTRVETDIVEEVKELKREPGKDIIVYGGAGIVSSFIRKNLIDEYHLFINPIAIGKGKTIFRSLESYRDLKLVSATKGSCGIMIMHYERNNSSFKIPNNETID